MEHILATIRSVLLRDVKPDSVLINVCEDSLEYLHLLQELEITYDIKLPEDPSLTPEKVLSYVKGAD